MAYRFAPEEDVRDALRRVAREQLDTALHALNDQLDDDPVKAVHTARKAVKKERSLLRLARASVPAKQRRAENAALRDASRGLADARDAEVMIQTLDQISERYAGQLPQSAFALVRGVLEQARDAERARLTGSAQASEAARELGQARERLDGWKLRRGGWPALEAGVGRSYRRGRRAMSDARRERSLEALHDWRKRVKDLWYHERLLAAAGGPAIRGQAKELDRLSDLLGDDHDLGVLHLRLTDGSLDLAADVDAIAGLLEHRRAELQAHAFLLGGRIYAEKPAAFVRRVRESWRAGRALADASDRPQPAELARATRASPAG